ncbi:MAG: DMT family transporter [Alphaproteobacteria bacterium]|nr:MAG: DMT family transporter [Alphaproteobacteria bacterium]
MAGCGGISSRRDTSHPQARLVAGRQSRYACAVMPSDPALARALPLLGIYRGLHPVAQGCALMVLGTFMFAGMHTAIRYSTQHLPPVEVAFFRNLFGLVVIAPLLVRYGLSLFHTKRVGLHMLRAVLNVVSMLAFFVGLSMTPLARATALTFTAPLFTALFSALFLGEMFRWRRWTAIFAGFFGALVILRPGLQVFDIGALLVLVSSLLWAMALIDIKVLGRTESTLTITVYVTVLLIPMTLAPAVLVWETPGLDMWVWLIFIGVIGTLGQLVVTEAVKLADMTVLMPFDFLKLVWAAFLGIIFFAEVPDFLTLRRLGRAPLPLCGEGSGVGVTRPRRCACPHPTPNPSPSRGGVSRRVRFLVRASSRLVVWLHA